MLSIVISVFHNLNNTWREELDLSAGYLVCAYAAGAIDCFAAVGTNTLTVVDGFSAVSALRLGCFLLQNLASAKANWDGHELSFRRPSSETYMLFLLA